MELVTTILLVILTTLLLKLYLSMKKSLKYWEERGVKHPKPTFFFGNWYDVQTLKMGEGDFFEKVYNDYPEEKYVGVYRLLEPVLLVRDPHLADKILASDFAYFTDRGLSFDTENNPMDDGIILRRGNRWKGMRMKLSPAFTSGKIKGMVDQMKKCADNLVKTIDKNGSNDVEMKDLMAVYTCDVIASCIFGLDLEAYLTPDSEFVQKAKDVFYMSRTRLMKFFVASSIPWLSKFISVSMTAPDIADFFGGLIRKTIDQRVEQKTVRNDFVQLLLQLKEQGSIKVQSKDPDDNYLMGNYKDVALEEEFTYETIVAQAYTFMSAGFDTTSTALHYLFFELSQNLEIQEKVREEVRRVYQEEGELSYQALQKMSYLESCIYETIRKYPGTHTYRRFCTKKYMLDGELELHPGQLVMISILGFHYDPKYFPNPTAFIPERMSDLSNKEAFLPFGTGPRMCIGMRIALIIMKMGAASILLNYKSCLSPKTKLPVKFDPQSFTLAPLDNIWGRFVPV